MAAASVAVMAGWSGQALAQSTVDELVVTATRREVAAQEAPINITAVGGDAIDKLGATDLADLANSVPGVHLVDQGGRTSDRIVVRGLNADPITQTDVLGNNAGETVSTYLGEIPIYIDLKLNDLERVEFLLGPQGTLYGAGTMGGAIRYIPRRPVFGARTVELRSELSKYDKAGEPSHELGLTFNTPVTDNLAVRGSVDWTRSSGFIDYVYTVRTPGVSNPNIVDPSDPSYDLVNKKDANWEDTLSGRLGVRWTPTAWLDANLTYYFQDSKVGARTVSSHRSILSTGEYESNLRVVEPNDRVNQLLALEWTADLGFAELVSATGYARYEEHGQRDQTNLLISLEYSYEAFPSFVAFTREDQKDRSITQELRLVSKGEGPLSWLVGGFYNDWKSDGLSREYTPGFSQYVLDAWGTGGALRPDNLEYFAPGIQKLKESAVFGELTWQITKAWQVTGGLRYYKYDYKNKQAVDLPLLYTSIIPDGRGPTDIVYTFNEDGQKDEGLLYKFNTSYTFLPDKMVFFTFSQGYRIGSGNGIAPCPDPIGNFQSVCALPDEVEYFPDKTNNFELGVHSQWLDRRLTLNGSIYYIKWEDPQLLSATVYGSGTIYKNGKGAETRGVEVAFSAKVTDALTIAGNYAYTRAELTEPASALISTIPDPNLPLGPGETPFGTVRIDGQPGDRLPGSPEHQFNFQVDYRHALGDGRSLNLVWNVHAVSDVFTRVGNRGGALELDGYAMHDVSVILSDEGWAATLFVNNVFDEFAETGVQGSPRHNQIVYDETGRAVPFRGFFTNPLPPRRIGVRFTRTLG